MKNTGNLLFAVFVLLFSAATSQAQTTGKSENSSAFVRLDRVTASRALPNGIEIRSGAALMQITALRDDVVRVRVGAEGQLPEDASWSVLPAARTASVPVAPESSPVAVGFKTAKLIVSIAKDPLALTVTDLAGHVIAQDMPQRPVEFHGAEFRVYRKSPIDEHYYGLGDKPGPLDRRNESFSNWNTDSFEWQESTDPIYKSIPFVLTLRKGIASGFFLDNTWRSNFEFNKEYRDGYSFGSEGGPLDYYILYGPEPKKVEETWAWLTGPTPLPPLWTFGFQQSRWAYAPESDVRRIATRMRAPQSLKSPATTTGSSFGTSRRMNSPSCAICRTRLPLMRPRCTTMACTRWPASISSTCSRPRCSKRWSDMSSCRWRTIGQRVSSALPCSPWRV